MAWPSFQRRGAQRNPSTVRTPFAAKKYVDRQALKNINRQLWSFSRQYTYKYYTCHLQVIKRPVHLHWQTRRSDPRVKALGSEVDKSVGQHFDFSQRPPTFVGVEKLLSVLDLAATAITADKAQADISRHRGGGKAQSNMSRVRSSIRRLWTLSHAAANRRCRPVGI